MFRGVASKFISNSYVGLALSFAIGAAILPFACDVIWQPLIKGTTDRLALHLAKSYGLHASDRGNAISCLSKYRLAWLYMTQNGQVVGGVAPELHQFADENREIGYDGNPYYESVVPLVNKEYLHVGVSEAAITDHLFASQLLELQLSLPLGYVLIELFLTLLVIAIFLNRAIMLPLQRLKQYSATLLKNEHQDSNDLEIGGTAEISQFGDALQQVRTAFNKISYEYLTNDHQLRKQRKELEAEKTTIQSDLQQRATDAEHSLSAFQTREIEAAFLTSLARELDAANSISQTCQITLARLNDKFPASLSCGAFFIGTAQGRFTIESSIGLNQHDLQLLNSADQRNMMAEWLRSGRSVAVDREHFSQYGLVSLTEAQFYEAVYLPISLQERKIGVLAFYATEPKQDINSRLRILRNTAELCARVLRLLLYRQELQVARTDALTGLYDRKFVNELLQRAIDNSNGHSISLMGIDVKQIGTSDARVKDQAMKELAQAVRKFTRMREIGIDVGRPSDYVIRFGTQQLLVILEKTHSARAILVAKRLGRIIAQRTHWSGDTATLSAAFGIATYPEEIEESAELLTKASIALRYAVMQPGSAPVCNISQVPSEFQVASESDEMK